MEKTELGLDQNIEGALCYLFVWISGIVFYILEDNNKYVRFHAIQSILVFLPLTVIGVLMGGFFGFGLWLGPGWFFLFWIGSIVWIIVMILWIILMLKAFKGEKYKVPIVGDIAEKKA